MILSRRSFLKMAGLTVVAAAGASMSVSYTHLDVYKRQRLVRLDLPTFGRPMMATGMRSSSTTVSLKSRWAHTCLLYTSRCV